MNNTYKAFLIIVFVNVMMTAVAGLTINPIYNAENTDKLKNELQSDEFLDENTDLTKDFTEQATPTWSMWKGIRTLFMSRITVNTTGLTGLSLLIMQITQYLVWALNMMGVILIVRMIRGSQ